ncbi:MAG: hypothetical protein ABFS09_02315 [Thermodesulfobacteriota bacterium]
MIFKNLLWHNKGFWAVMSSASILLLFAPLSWATGASNDKLKMVELTPGNMMTASQAPERDPFNWPPTQRVRLRQIAEAEQDIFADFTLQAIVWSKKVPQAVINSQLSTIGDMVDGALVVNITETRVSLTKNGRAHLMQFDTLDIDFGRSSHAKGNIDDTK